MPRHNSGHQCLSNAIPLAATAGILYVLIWGVDLRLSLTPSVFVDTWSTGPPASAAKPRLWAYVDTAALVPDAGVVAPASASLYDDVPAYETLGRNDLVARIQRIRDELGPLLTARVHEGTAAVSLRDLCASLGNQFTWDGAGPALVSGSEGVTEFAPGSRTARRNLHSLTLPAPPFVEGHDLYVPVRSAAVALGLELTQERGGSVVCLTRGATTVRALIPAQAFSIEIDRSDRWVRVFYAGELAKHYRACTGAGENTPVGRFHIQNKCVWPGWRAYWGEFIPGGSSRNPLGARFMGTSARGRVTGWTIGIHGTNQPSSIGRRISGGCVRLPNPDIIELYEVIPIGTRVTIHE
ncbi:MAG: L,D-transpeptidase family protein [Armatimonadetes bacterium]|nr:L,D-transpeptidase family protein [Armatimonadota bacterium]MDI9586113.1 L,D-transpeptidase family protein [Acidobacteriota bacterium]